MVYEEEVLERRKAALLKGDELTNQCKACTLRLPSTFDKKLPCCTNCPVQKQLYKVREVLDGTMGQLRAIRRKGNNKRR